MIDKSTAKIIGMNIVRNSLRTSTIKTAQMKPKKAAITRVSRTVPRNTLLSDFNFEHSFESEPRRYRQYEKNDNPVDLDP